MAKINEDNATPSQNNYLLCFKIAEGQWFGTPEIAATCFEVFHTKSDQNELYSGKFGSVVAREDIGDGIINYRSEIGQVSSAGGDGTTLAGRKKRGSAGVAGAGGDEAVWTVDEWAGATLYFQRQHSMIIESTTVESNTASVLTGTAGSFSGADANAWEGAAPTEYDNYLLVLNESGDGKMKLRWKTHRLTTRQLKRLKQFIDFVLNINASGAVTVKWNIDNGKATGAFQYDPLQGATHWGIPYYFNDAATGNALLWQTAGDQEFTSTFNDTAEGHYVELEIEIDTNQHASIILMMFEYLQHDGKNWR